MNRKIQLGLAIVVLGIALSTIQLTLPGGWSTMLAGLGQTANAFVTVPLWVIAVLTGLLLFGLGAIVAAATRNRERPSEQSLVPFTTAEVFGIRWRWRYENGDICDITPFCPLCARQVTPVKETRHGFLHLICYHCECRKWRSRSFQCSAPDMLERVHYSILQQARTRKPRVGSRRSVTG